MIVGSSKVIVGSTKVIVCSTKVIVGSTKVIVCSTKVMASSTKVIVCSTKVYLVYNGQSGWPGVSRAIQRALQGYLATIKINCCFFSNNIAIS